MIRVCSWVLMVLLLLPLLGSAPVVSRGAGGADSIGDISLVNGCVSVSPASGQDNTALLRQAVALAGQTVGKCVRLQAGVYLITVVDQPMLTLNIAGLDFSGASAQSTVIQYADNLSIGAGAYYTYGLFVTANDVFVHNLAVRGGAGMHNPPGVEGIWGGIEVQGLRDTLQNLDVSGAWGPLGTAGGFAIGTYQGQAGLDNRTDTRILYNNLHDNPSGLGLVLASNGNLVQGNHIWNTGENAHQHAIYDQGGMQEIVDNVLGPNPAAGYNYHGHHTIECTYGGSTVLAHNISLNPGFGHVVVDSVNTCQTNPEIPPGQTNTPDVIISGNAFRNTGGNTSVGLFLYEGVHAVVEGNTFENMGVAITSREANLIASNQIIQITDTGQARIGIYNVGAGALIAGNVISLPLGSQQTGIRSEADNARIINNTVTISNGVGLFVGGANPLVESNSVLGTHGSTALELHTDGARVQGNALNSDWVAAITQVPITATVSDNSWGSIWRVDGSYPGLTFAGNRGSISYFGSFALSLGAGAGALGTLPHVPGSPISKGDLLTWAGSGLVRAPANSGYFSGVNISDEGTTLSSIYVVEQEGARLVGVCVTGSATVGDVGVVGDSPGCLTDTGGPTPPQAGSWARFLPGGEVEIHP